MKVLVIGASGQVGRACMRAFADRGFTVEGTSSNGRNGLRAVDLISEEALRGVIRDSRPDWCVLTAAMTHVDGCEDRPEQAYRLNAEAPGWAAEETRKAGGRLVFLSTEYVFDGKNGPYLESDPVNAISVYGASKLEGERRVLGDSSSHLVARTTVVYSYQPDGKNFLMQLWQALSQGRSMRVPRDQISSPTYAPDLGGAIAALAERGAHGILHVAGPEILDRYQFARRAAKILGFSDELLQPVETRTLAQKAARPLVAGLRIDRFKQLLGDMMRGPEEGVSEFAKLARAAGPLAVGETR